MFSELLVKKRGPKLAESMKSNGPSTSGRVRKSRLSTIPKKVSTRRATTVQIDEHSKNTPRKVSARRVTFSGSDTVSWIEEVPQRRLSQRRCATKPILKHERNAGARDGLSLAEKIKTLTRDVFVVLERLPEKRADQVIHNDDNPPQQEVIPAINAPQDMHNDSSPEQEVILPIDEQRQQPEESTEGGKNPDEVNKQKSDGSNDVLEPLPFCEDCAASLDPIFKAKCQAYIAPTMTCFYKKNR